MLTLVLISILLWLYFQWKWRKLIEVAKVLKHDLLSLPFIGIAYLFIGDGKAVMQGIEKLRQEAYRQNGVISCWAGHHLFVLFADPDLAHFVSRACLEKHGIMKTCMQPLFRNSHLIAPEASMDRKFDFQNIEEHSFITGFEEVTEIVGGRFFKPWLYTDFIFGMLPDSRVVARVLNAAYEYAYEGLQSKKKSLNEISYPNTSGTKVKSFAEQLLTAEKLDDTEITEEVLGLILAGTDTTAVSACFCISMLAYHPEAQEKIYHEISELPPDFGISDLTNLKYLDAFIKETLRLYPAVPVIVRTVEDDVTLPTGVVLPKGCGILIHLRAINMNPKYWGPDAEKFRPERFLETQTGSPKHQAQFAPFSLGPRNCIGIRFALMSLKITISTVVRHLRVYPATDVKIGGTNFKLAYGITIKDDDNFPLVFKSRT